MKRAGDERAEQTQPCVISYILLLLMLSLCTLITRASASCTDLILLLVPWKKGNTKTRKWDRYQGYNTKIFGRMLNISIISVCLWGGLNACVQRKRPFSARPQQFLDAADNLWLFFQKWDFSSHLASRSSQSQAHFHTGKVSYYFELLNPAHGYRYCMCSWRESTHTLMHKLCMKIEKRGRRINRAVGKNKIFSTYFSFIGGTIGHSSPLFPHLKIKHLEMT